MNSLFKGDIAEKKFELMCIENNIEIFKPVNSGNMVDYIINVNGVLKRIQVKYITPRNNRIDVALFKTSHNTLEKDIRYYTLSNTDLFLIYSDNIWYSIPLPSPSNPIKQVCLRTCLPKNNQRKNVNFASDFIFDIKNWCSH